jgi:glycosyltransferase involved in cell wall biosynthesis
VRLFQNIGIYPSYRPRLAQLTRECTKFSAAIRAFLHDRFGATHFLQPVLSGDPDAFFANGDDEFSQRLWAKEQGLARQTPLEDILLAQIEHHRAEVFYNLDPMRYGDAFLARLPGSVRRTIAWRAAPSAGGAFLNYDVIVNNFPSLLAEYRVQGARAEYFFPGHDPEMDAYAANRSRPIDVLFVGTYSRHHVRRAALLEAVAGLGGECNVALHLDRSRFTALAESPIGLIGPLRKYRRPHSIRTVARAPLFGRDLLHVLSQTKIVFNGAIDMAGEDRGNLRVWEALGCGAAMVSDKGTYPQPMLPGRDFVTYANTEEASLKIRHLLDNPLDRAEIAQHGHDMIRTAYSKEAQWQAFTAIAS